MGTYACLGPDADCYCVARITLGAHSVVSQGAFLCAASHDIDDDAFPLVTKPIVIGDHAWVAAGAFVGPGVTLGRAAVLGARAVTFKDIPASQVHIGNPARFTRVRRAQLGHLP